MNKHLITAIWLMITCCLLCPMSSAWAAEITASPQDKIIDDCTTSIATNPNDYVSYLNRAQAYRKKNLFDEALADCNKAIEVKPDYAAAYFERGWINQTRKNWDAAIDNYTQTMNLDPSFYWAYNNRAACNNQKGQSDLVIPDATRAIELNPKRANPYFHLGWAYAQKHQYEDAISTYRGVIANCSDPNDIEKAKDRIRALGGNI